MWIIATGLVPVNADAMMQWYFSSTVPGLQHYSLSSMPSIQRCLLLCQHETHQTSELGFVQTQYALFRLLYLILLSGTPSSNFPSEFLPENFGNRIRSTTKTSDSEKCLTFQAHADVGLWAILHQVRQRSVRYTPHPHNRQFTFWMDPLAPVSSFAPTPLKELPEDTKGSTAVNPVARRPLHSEHGRPSLPPDSVATWPIILPTYVSPILSETPPMLALSRLTPYPYSLLQRETSTQMPGLSSAVDHRDVSDDLAGRSQDRTVQHHEGNINEEPRNDGHIEDI